MTRRSFAFAALLLTLLFGVGSKPAEKADLVLRHGRIYTMDAVRSWAESVAIKNGKIVFIGSDSQIESWIHPGTQVIELSGKMVLPSFIDSHVHPVSAGMEMGQLDFGTLSTKEEILKAIANYACFSSG